MFRTFLPVVALCSGAFAAQASAADWTLDAANSRLGFEGTQTGQPFKGTFKAWTAAIAFDPAKPEAAHIVATVDTGSAATDDTQRDEALPGDDWFAASQFPKAVFEATGFMSKGGDLYEARGKLTIKGISKDVLLPFALKIDGDIAHATGKASILRTDFGVGQGAWSTDQYVALAVDVTIDLTAKRAP